MISVVIMAGGAGKRFWPLSRKSLPKQFLKIASEKSMIRMTAERLLSRIQFKDIHVVTTFSQKQLVIEHLPELPQENIIIEPQGMNTAPAIALSAMFLNRKYTREDRMLVLPSDHVINDVPAFLESLTQADKAADKDNLVTFGIVPSYPATGYGYIESGKDMGYGFHVRNFKEKPDIKKAEEFISSGNYFWNGGMFFWKIGTILEAYQKYLPKLSGLTDEISKKWDKLGMEADISDIYSKMPRIPVDIGIMEQADNRIVIPVDYGWSDIGGWKAVYDLSRKDDNGNVINCDSEIIDTHGCYVNSNKFVALSGVKDLIVVDTPDALLITDMEQSESVKDIVSVLEKKGNDRLT